MKKIAAIDIGSNAVRLAIAECEGTKLVITKKLRAPLRLGTEAFDNGIFSQATIKQAVKIFEDFSYAIDHEHVGVVKTVATSAFRDTKNSQDLADAVKKSCGLTIEAIDGTLEATLVRQAINTKLDLKGKSALMMDIGGGSMELSILHKGVLKGAKSFDVGTVRLLQQGNDLLLKREKEIESFIQEHASKLDLTRMIGTGGNFRAMLKLKQRITKLNKVDFVTQSELKDLHTILEHTPYLKRIKKYGMRPDRADVIMPAIDLVLMVGKKVPFKRIYAPNVGLIHGVLIDLCQYKISKIKDITN